VKQLLNIPELVEALDNYSTSYEEVLELYRQNVGDENEKLGLEGLEWHTAMNLLSKLLGAFGAGAVVELEHRGSGLYKGPEAPRVQRALVDEKQGVGNGGILGLLDVFARCDYVIWIRLVASDEYNNDRVTAHFARKLVKAESELDQANREKQDRKTLERYRASVRLIKHDLKKAASGRYGKY